MDHLVDGGEGDAQHFGCFGNSQKFFHNECSFTFSLIQSYHKPTYCQLPRVHKFIDLIWNKGLTIFSLYGILCITRCGIDANAYSEKKKLTITGKKVLLPQIMPEPASQLNLHPFVYFPLF